MRKEFKMSFRNGRSSVLVTQIMKTFRLTQAQATDFAMTLLMKELMIVASMA